MAKRINPDTGVIEESYGGLFWNPVRYSSDWVFPEEHRVNTDTGELEKSNGGLFWNPTD